MKKWGIAFAVTIFAFVISALFSIFLVYGLTNIGRYYFLAFSLILVFRLVLFLLKDGDERR